MHRRYSMTASRDLVTPGSAEYTDKWYVFERSETDKLDEPRSGLELAVVLALAAVVIPVVAPLYFVVMTAGLIYEIRTAP